MVGLKNGVLLDMAERNGFDLFITADQELSYQQNLTRRRIAVLVLSTNNWSIVKERIAAINSAVASAAPGTLVFVDIGHGVG